MEMCKQLTLILYITTYGSGLWIMVVVVVNNSDVHVTLVLLYLWYRYAYNWLRYVFGLTMFDQNYVSSKLSCECWLCCCDVVWTNLLKKTLMFITQVTGTADVSDHNNTTNDRLTSTHTSLDLYLNILFTHSSHTLYILNGQYLVTLARHDWEVQQQRVRNVLKRSVIKIDCTVILQLICVCRSCVSVWINTQLKIAHTQHTFTLPTLMSTNNNTHIHNRLTSSIVCESDQ